MNKVVKDFMLSQYGVLQGDIADTLFNFTIHEAITILYIQSLFSSFTLLMIHITHGGLGWHQQLSHLERKLYYDGSYQEMDMVTI